MPKHRRRSPSEGIPPSDLIQEDFEALKSSVFLRTTRFVEDLILMQSIEGHAHEGHGAFRGRRFVNTTLRDTVKALHRKPRAVAEQRQRLIDDIFDWSRHCIDGNPKTRLTDADEEPFLGLGMFRHIVVDPADILRGLYLGGLRDDVDVRGEVEKERGIKVGGGRCYLVDVRIMREIGLDGQALSQGEHENRIQEYRERGMILDSCPPEGAPEVTAERVRYMYIRHRRGPGASDDAAIVAAGRIYNRDVAIGVFLSDAIDTMEKYVPLGRYCDQDDELSRVIDRNFAELHISKEEVHRLTYLSAVPEGIKSEVPDSSLRHLLTVDRRVDQCALESHLLYVQGKPYAPMLIAFEQVMNTRFYSWLEDRMNQEL